MSRLAGIVIRHRHLIVTLTSTPIARGLTPSPFAVLRLMTNSFLGDNSGSRDPFRSFPAWGFAARPTAKIPLYSSERSVRIGQAAGQFLRGCSRPPAGGMLRPDALCEIFATVDFF